MRLFQLQKWCMILSLKEYVRKCECVAFAMNNEVKSWEVLAKLLNKNVSSCDDQAVFSNFGIVGTMSNCNIETGICR